MKALKTRDDQDAGRLHHREVHRAICTLAGRFLDLLSGTIKVFIGIWRTGHLHQANCENIRWHSWILCA